MIDRIIQLKQLLAAEPTDTFCLYSLGQEHAKIGQFSAGISYYDQAILLDPTFCYAYFHKARCLEELGDLPGAIETLRTGLGQARLISDHKAMSEIQSYLDSLTDL